MGLFLATTAFRSNSVDDVVSAITEYLASHDVKFQMKEESWPLSEAIDAMVFAPQNGWVVVLWPNYFNVHDFPMLTSIGNARGWLISGVHVYDGDYWEHLAVRGPERLHEFSSRPTYWSDVPEELERAAGFDTDPARISAALGIPGDALQPYLVDAANVSDTTKAHAEDRFELANIWVFTDFWKRLGITYPDPPNNPTTVVRLSKWFAKRLPSG
jgi:hypothetical protein